MFGGVCQWLRVVLAATVGFWTRLVRRVGFRRWGMGEGWFMGVPGWVWDWPGVGLAGCGIGVFGGVVSGSVCWWWSAAMWLRFLGRRPRRVCLRLWMTAPMRTARVCAARPGLLPP